MYKIWDKRADWARSPDEGCVNRIYRATLQKMGEEIFRKGLKTP